MPDSEKLGWFIVEDSGQTLEDSSPHEAFELNKVDSKTLINFGAWLKVLATKAEQWSKSTLRFVEGPEGTVKAIRSFPGIISALSSSIPSTGGEADGDAPFPKALDESIKWGEKAAKAIAGTEQEGLADDILSAIKSFKEIDKIIDSLEDVKP